MQKTLLLPAGIIACTALIACIRIAGTPTDQTAQRNTTPRSTPDAIIDDVAATFRHARIYLPQATQPTTIDHIPSGTRHPVIVFLHGCWGMDTDEHHNWASLFASLGLLVVMPDSFARSSRKPNCGSLEHNGGEHPHVHPMRLEEVEHAVRQIRRQPWHDGRHLFLAGYSEGAIAAVRTPTTGLRGVIALSWTCTHRQYPPLDGIALPRETPLLTIAVDNDPWMSTPNLAGDCGQKMTGRPDAQHIALPGQPGIVRLAKRAGRKFLNIPIDHRENHATSEDEHARLEVARFVRRLMTHPS